MPRPVWNDKMPTSVNLHGSVEFITCSTDSGGPNPQEQLLIKAAGCILAAGRSSFPSMSRRRPPTLDADDPAALTSERAL